MITATSMDTPKLKIQCVQLSLMNNTLCETEHGVEPSFSSISIPAIMSLSVFVLQPDLQILLKGVYSFIEFFAICNVEVFIQNCTVEAFDDPLVLGVWNLVRRYSMSLRKRYKLKGRAGSATEFGSFVGQDAKDSQQVLLIEELAAYSGFLPVCRKPKA